MALDAGWRRLLPLLTNATTRKLCHRESPAPWAIAAKPQWRGYHGPRQDQSDACLSGWRSG